MAINKDQSDKAPEKQRPDGAAGAFGFGDTGVSYNTGTAQSFSTGTGPYSYAVKPALFPYPIH